jgi:hypothetical protein
MAHISNPCGKELKNMELLQHISPMEMSKILGKEYAAKTTP